MDSIQLLLIAILIITTILMIVVGIQLISTLSEIRKTVKINSMKPEKINRHEVNIKKNSDKKRYSGMHSIIDKMRILSPVLHSKRKKFFVKDR